MNKLAYVVIVLLLSFIFKDQIFSYVDNINVKTTQTVDEIEAKKSAITNIYNNAEKLIFKDAPDDPNPKPVPGEKCQNCKGTGKVTQGDGHVTACSICDGKGVIPKATFNYTSSEIEERYKMILGLNGSEMCRGGEYCETNIYE